MPNSNQELLSALRIVTSGERFETERSEAFSRLLKYPGWHEEATLAESALALSRYLLGIAAGHKGVPPGRIDPRDVCQESLLQFYVSAPTLRNQTLPGAKNFLWGIVRIVSLRMAEAEGFLIDSGMSLEQLEDVSVPGGNLTQREAACLERYDILRKAVEQLSSPLRVTVELYLDNMTEADIARTLGIPYGTVRVRLRRARVHLGRLLAGTRNKDGGWSLRLRLGSKQPR